MTALELLACAALAGISAWLSSSEIALFSLSRFQLRSLKERFRSAHRRIKRLLSDPTGLLITILVANEVVNVGLSSLIEQAITRARKPTFLANIGIPHWMLDTFLGLLVSTPIVLLLCDITPKILGARANRVIAPLTSRPLTALYDLLKPIRLVLKAVVERVARWATPRVLGQAATSELAEAHSEEGGKLLREADFLLMVEEGRREGAVQQTELELIKNVFELDDTTVAEVFTPLPQVQAVTEHTSLRNALNMMRSQKFSRIPVTTAVGSSGRRQVVGVLYSKDLLRAKLDPQQMSSTVDTLMHKPLFVNATMNLNSLFRLFKQRKTHMAVVRGASGDTLGIVTMTDVLETLFEDVLPDDEEGRL